MLFQPVWKWGIVYHKITVWIFEWSFAGYPVIPWIIRPTNYYGFNNADRPVFSWFFPPRSGLAGRSITVPLDVLSRSWQVTTRRRQWRHRKTIGRLTKNSSPKMVDRSVWKVRMDPKKSEGRNFVRYPDRDMIQLNMEICWERWEDQRGVGNPPCLGL